MIDLTRGKLLQSLNLQLGIPSWSQFSMGRVRQATSIELPTTGHLLSHNRDELREALQNVDRRNILVLDDTSFSGSTSLVFEELLRSAFPQESMVFTHGFMLLNTGQLGPQPGAQERLQINGDTTVSGTTFQTPRDDGWHFFDMVSRTSPEEHYLVVAELLRLLSDKRLRKLSSALFSNESTLRLLFPEALSADELRDRQKTGHFRSTGEIKDGFHVRNPQLLPNIIGQQHLLPMEQWKTQPQEAFALLVRLSTLLAKGNI